MLCIVSGCKNPYQATTVHIVVADTKNNRRCPRTFISDLIPKTTKRRYPSALSAAPHSFLISAINKFSDLLCQRPSSHCVLAGREDSRSSFRYCKKVLEFSFFLFLYFKSLYQTGHVTVRNSFLFSAAVSSERERSWGARENRKGLGRDRGIERTLMMVSLVCVYPFDSSNLSSLSFHIYALPLNLQLSAILPKRLSKQQMSAFSAQPIVIDGKGHLLGRLASVVAKQVSVSENIF